MFGKLPAIEDPVISPDGKVLAAKMRAKGEQYLVVLPLDVPNPAPKLIARDGDFDKLADETDARRHYVRLTDTGQARMNAYFAECRAELVGEMNSG